MVCWREAARADEEVDIMQSRLGHFIATMQKPLARGAKVHKRNYRTSFINR